MTDWKALALAERRRRLAAKEELLAAERGLFCTARELATLDLPFLPQDTKQSTRSVGVNRRTHGDVSHWEDFVSASVQLVGELDDMQI